MKAGLKWIKRMWRAEGLEEENAEILLRMKGDGDDLTKPHVIEFHHLFDREQDASTFDDVVRGQGYAKSQHEFWPELQAWLSTVSVHMVPDLGEITTIERALNETAVVLEGKPDGWGCMEVIPMEKD